MFEEIKSLISPQNGEGWNGCLCGRYISKFGNCGRRDFPPAGSSFGIDNVPHKD